MFRKKKSAFIFFNYYGYYSGTFYPREHLNSGYVILKQAEHYLDYDKRIVLAREIIQTATRNILVILKYYNSRGINLGKEMESIESKIDKMEHMSKIEQLMALEGNIRDEYYNCFNKIINNFDFKFTIRSKRPPLDNINSLISFGNAIMYTTILGGEI